jgi:hypothetical protein
MGRFAERRDQARNSIKRAGAAIVPNGGAICGGSFVFSTLPDVKKGPANDRQRLLATAVSV